MKKVLHFFFILVLSIGFNSCKPPVKEDLDLVSFVNTFIGTGGHGHTYPGASMPFGMMQLSPDTRLEGWDGCSGYHYSDSIIYGFSHTHLSGTGIPDYADVLFMPTVGEVHLNNGSKSGHASGYGSQFKHKQDGHGHEEHGHGSEFASPGYYQVYLEDYNIDVELTVTERAGMHRYDFPDGEGNLIIDLVHRDKVLDSRIEVVNETEIAGYRISSSWAKEQHVYFVAQFSAPFLSYGLAENDSVLGELSELEGDHVKAYFKFEGLEEALLVKVGISAVSIEGARRNLEAEIPHWNFEQVRQQASDAWNRELNKIQVEGGTKDQKTIFYTALYHSMLAPNVYSDVDGQYRGMDHKIHQADNTRIYTVFSFWDTFRAAHPLYTIIDQKRTNEFINTLLAKYENGGRLPIWELACNYTDCMIGYHAIPVIADAYVKGIRDYDIEKVYAAMKVSADADSRGLDAYKEIGYIPANHDGESVSKTLEYAYDDWCIAQMAEQLDKPEDYVRYIERAQFYKNIYDPGSGFMRAKRNQSWMSPFDPAEVNFCFTEANSWQYSFFVPQDVEGLIKITGGKEKFSQRLDDLFSVSSETSGRTQSDITGLIGQYAHGNEPSHHMAYLYNFVGQPWKTQERVSEIMQTLYSNAPDGLSGNEDCGQMSAWYVLSAMGFYPVCPGSTNYLIGSPIFEKVTLHLENGNRFVIEARNVSSEGIYIRSAHSNGRTYDRNYIEHELIMQGGRLEFQMSKIPSTTWAVSKDSRPVSLISKNRINPVPYIEADAITFKDEMEIKIRSLNGARIYYSMDITVPNESFNLYSEPIKITESSIVRTYAVTKGMVNSRVVTAEYFKLSRDWSIEVFTQAAPQYHATGDFGLIDMIRGGSNFLSGDWHGYEGIDFEAVIDLGETKTISKISAGFLQNVNSWIWFPKSVLLSFSENGEKYRFSVPLHCKKLEDEYGEFTEELSFEFQPQRARYVKVEAKNLGTIPEWHPGSGGKPWIFIDEISVE
ncbi:MAG: GH92 family glycosyl hydrolase [Bacteroidetes bacterium]|nr:GH92 family glycosyl hydrolase [Bacteroidota bacterium]